MRRTLLATALLSLIPTLAGAEITITGEAWFGIVNGLTLDPALPDDTGLASRARLGVDMNGQTDGGLEFGATLRLDEADNAAAGSAGSVWMSGGFGTLTVGNVDGAAAAAVGSVDGVGLTGLGNGHKSLFLTSGDF